MLYLCIHSVALLSAAFATLKLEDTHTPLNTNSSLQNPRLELVSPRLLETRRMLNKVVLYFQTYSEELLSKCYLLWHEILSAFKIIKRPSQ